MKYRKKSVVIEAITFDELVKYELNNCAHNQSNDMPRFFEYGGWTIAHETDECYLIPTLEGTCRLTPDDMLITGVQGEIYPCKIDIFKSTYEPCEDNINRTLFEIIEAVKDGERPKYDELRYALLATDFMLTDINQFVLMDLYSKGKLESWDKIRYKMKYDNHRKALNTDPKTYIGSFDPDAPGRQEERAMFKRVFDKFINK